MHNAAKQWDKEHPREVPKDRPCDWCGNKVEIGCIHLECLEKEQKFYSELWYD